MINEYTQPEDFLTDESFLAWHYRSNPSDVALWEEWMTADDQRKSMMRRAVELLESLKVNEKQLMLQQVDAAETRLMKKIGQGSGRSPLISRFVWTAAASVIFIIGSYYLAKSFIHSKQAITTNYGEIKEQKLPDGTEVKLNANSNVSYADRWKEGQDREVWLNGEAFFHVKKTPEKSRFIVHTDHFDVIVTGTQFNVVNRNGQSNVMLNEGSVTVHSTGGNDIKMMPGEFVEFNLNQTQKRIIRNDSLLAWRDKRIVFESTPLNEVVVMIKNHYGVDVRLGDLNVGSKTISGVLPNDNLDVLLQSIDATNDFEVVHQGREISIKSRQ